MNQQQIDAIIAYVNELFRKELGRVLSPTEEFVLRSSLRRKQYAVMAREGHYGSGGHLKMVGSKLWRDLSLVMHQPIKKKNCGYLLTFIDQPAKGAESDRYGDRSPSWSEKEIPPSRSSEVHSSESVFVIPPWPERDFDSSIGTGRYEISPPDSGYDCEKSPSQESPTGLRRQLYRMPFEREGVQGEEVLGSVYSLIESDNLSLNDSSLVDCSVFGPQAIEPSETAMLQVFVHFPEHQQQALHAALMADCDASLRSTKTLGLPVRIGELLTFNLIAPGLLIDSPVQSLRWFGQTTSVDFLITAPDISAKATFGTVIVSRDTVPLGTLKFKLKIDRQAVPQAPCFISSAARQFHKAFVSYSTQDQKEVLKRVQVLVRTGIEVFQDLLSLTPGERFERRLFEKIADVDLFLLFWSAAARESEWVIREARHALQCQGMHPDHLPEIIPIILEQEFVEPPSELSHLHFRDVFTYLIAATS